MIILFQKHLDNDKQYWFLKAITFLQQNTFSTPTAIKSLFPACRETKIRTCYFFFPFGFHLNGKLYGEIKVLTLLLKTSPSSAIKR